MHFYTLSSVIGSAGAPNGWVAANASSSSRYPSSTEFWNIIKISHGQSFGNKWITFFNSPSNLLIILYQLTKFEAPSYNTFQVLLITNFQCPTLQRVIIRKKSVFFSPGNLLIILYQLTLSLKLLALKFFFRFLSYKIAS